MIGAGGMGEVYRARDTRLDRTVAIKVLSMEFAGDADRQARFVREARAVAALNHAHICAIHDVGEAPPPATSNAGADPIRFLVMEHLEGQTLAERLVRGSLPAPDVMRYATELADALDHAHRRGLVHRDLKPSNVMLLKTGTKLLDFGLSKLNAPSDLLALSTVSPDVAPLTAAGAVLGTYPYMAPEQLAGQEADARSDLFAFGAIVYEMATGRRAFEGTSAATVIGAVLHVDPPPISSLQPLTPAALDRIVTRCLAKDPDDRWQTARDVLLELKWIDEHAEAPTAERPRPRKRRLVSQVAAAAAAIAIGVAAFAAGYLQRGASDESPIRLAFTPPVGVTLADAASGAQVSISPDGRLLAFVAETEDGTRRLWVRRIDSPNAQLLPGTEGVVQPFWSPDSAFIGFFAQDRLKRTPATGGPVQTLADAVLPRGAAWSQSGVVLFSANAGRQLYRVPAVGGVVEPVVIDQPNDESHSPDFLPDGRRFVYFARRQKPGIYIGSLDSKETTFLTGGYGGVAYAAPGYLLLIAGGPKSETSGTLVAQRFDSDGLRLVGDPVTIAEQVAVLPTYARGAFSVSDNGRVVFGSARDQIAQLMWLDRQGNRVGTLAPPSTIHHRLDLSPDGRTVAVEKIDPETDNPDIWLMDTTRGVTSRFTFDPGPERFPIWSRDGDRILFSSPRGGRPPTLYVKLSSGARDEELLFGSDVNLQPNDWHPDGRLVVYQRLDPKTQWDLWTVPADPSQADRDRAPMPYLRTPFNERQSRFSPNGKWLAYVSDESGRSEVYVRAFPDGATRYQVSTMGGVEPRWRRDGIELFYASFDGWLMAVDVRAAGGIEVGIPRPLFKTRFASFGAGEGRPVYVPKEDGQRFLINAVVEETASSPVTVVLNWPAAFATR
jgi:serine/threonine protein kinase/Tol biopolymer transport system component